MLSSPVAVGGIDVDGASRRPYSNPTGFNIRFYQTDASNLPGTLIAERLNQPFVGLPGGGQGDYRITITNPVSLPAGLVWVEVQARLDLDPGAQQWYWRLRNLQTSNGAAWRNPGRGLGLGCQAWTRRTICNADADDSAPDQVFRLCTGTCFAGQPPPPPPLVICDQFDNVSPLNGFSSQDFETDILRQPTGGRLHRHCPEFPPAEWTSTART